MESRPNKMDRIYINILEEKMGNTEIKLSFTLDEVNRILGILGDKPFVQVADLISKISDQAQGQLPEQPQSDIVTDEQA